MPLESLNGEQTNIHDLTLEVEKKPMPEWQKKYEELKKTELYDAKRDQWIEHMEEDQNFEEPMRETNVQLISIMIESQINKNRAKEMYNNLKNSSFYDNELKRWNKYRTDDEGIGTIERRTDDQLLGILVESQFDKGSAWKQYKALKQTTLFNEDTKQWNLFIDEGRNQVNTTRGTGTQLIGILIEAQFDVNLAKKLYVALQKTSLYDEVRKQWNDHMDAQQMLGGSGRPTEYQLLGIMVEAQFDKASAQKQFKSLKNTALYDKNQHSWNRYMEENQQDTNTECYSNVQLLSILCEKEVGEPIPNLNTNLPLPEKRSY